MNIYIVSVQLKSDQKELAEHSLQELRELTITLDYNIVDCFIQSREAYDSNSCIGHGKIQEIAERKEHDDVELVVFNNQLTPKQLQVLEKSLECTVFDKTQIILEIFSKHAQTKEAKTQVKLAYSYYMLPRLVGLWSHLDREKGGSKVSKGMGEKQINVDRNILRRDIARLKSVLEQEKRIKQEQSKRRDRCFQVSLVGYTNAGKTSIINVLTDANLLAQDKLFVSLDSTTRIIDGLMKPNILLSDTVGFLQELPHELIASFQSTLNVVSSADLLIHVIDASNKLFEERIEVVTQTLKTIKAENIPCILLFNKMDLVDSTHINQLLLKNLYPNALFISTLNPEHAKSILHEAIKDYFNDQFKKHTLKIPYDKSSVYSMMHDQCIIENTRYQEDCIEVDFTISRFFQDKFYHTVAQQGIELQ